MTIPDDIITILYIILLGQGVVILGYIIAVLVDVKRSAHNVTLLVEKTRVSVDKAAGVVNLIESKMLSLVALVDVVGEIPRQILKSWFGTSSKSRSHSREDEVRSNSSSTTKRKVV